MSKLFLLLMTIALFGCKSEVDKCVEAQVKTHKPWEKDPIVEGKGRVASKEDVEAEARLLCLQAANGKL